MPSHLDLVSHFFPLKVIMRVGIVGGGVSGLAAAHYLLKHPLANKKVREVVVMEGSSRVGGWIQSTTLEDGVTYEHGPRTVRPAGAVGINTLSLIRYLEATSGIYRDYKCIFGGLPVLSNCYQVSKELAQYVAS